MSQPATITASVFDAGSCRGCIVENVNPSAGVPDGEKAHVKNFNARDRAV